jgi:hypothetical protein
LAAGDKRCEEALPVLLATPCTIHLKREYPLEMEMPQPPWNQVHELILEEVDSFWKFLCFSLLKVCYIL